MYVENVRLSLRLFLLLFLSGLLISIAAAIPETSPGYMDADYYYAGAVRFAGGQGTSEPYLWNYLNDPQALPAPSFAYWMPLASLVMSIGLRLFPAWEFWGARLPLILLAALVPVMTAQLALHLGGKPATVRLAGILALFPGFYLAYMTTSDVFALEMMLGSQFILLVIGESRVPAHKGHLATSLGLGLIAGMLHLARADGVLWLGGALAAVFLAWFPGRRASFSRLLLSVAAVLTGYLLVISPWLARNLGEWGHLFPPGGSRTLWLSEYEQTMIYPASVLTPRSWLAAGWEMHLQARLNAAAVVLQTAVAVQGGIVLFPFILAGLWSLRRNASVRLGVGMWALMALVMTLVFPFAAKNGSYFHSAAALQPLLWAVAPFGLESLMLRYTQWRKISAPQAMVRFMALLIVFTGVLLSAGIYYQRVFGGLPGPAKWNASSSHYRAVEEALVRLGAVPGEAALVNNPPGYWLASGRPALVIPYGDTKMLLAVARQYEARFLVLEQTNPWQLTGLYHGRETPAELEFLSEVKTTRLYRIKDMH